MPTKKNKPTIFVTYNWNDASNAFILLLEKELKKFNVVYDKKNVDDWDSLTHFMDTIKKEDFVVQLVTKKYLESVNCLYEVMSLMKRPDWKTVTMTIVLSDIKEIYDDGVKLDIVKYWTDRTSEIENKLNKLPESSTQSLKSMLNKYTEIRDNIGEFLLIATDRKNPEFEHAIDAIKKKVKPSRKKKTRKATTKSQGKISPKGLIALNDIWQRIVPLRDGIYNIESARHTVGQIQTLKNYQNDIAQLRSFFDANKQYLQDKIRTTIKGNIDAFEEFIINGIKINSFECTSRQASQHLQGNMVAYCGQSINFLINQANQLKASLNQLCNEVESIVMNANQ